MIKIKKIRESLKKSVWIIGRNSAPTFFILFFVTFILGGFIFYKYSFLAEKIEPQITEQPLRFKESLFQEILKEWENREKRFEEAELKEYPDPFRAPALIPEETSPEVSEELTE